MAKRRANGEGSIRQRKDGRWLVELAVGIQDNGKPKKIWKYAKTQREGIEILNGLKAELGLGVDHCAGSITTGSWCATWLKLYKQKLAPSTLTSYSNNIRIHINPFMGGVPLNKLTTQQIQFMLNGVYDGGRNSLSLFIKVYNVLNGALEKAVELGMLVKNPCKGVAFPAEDKQPVRAFTEEQQKLFVGKLKEEPLQTRVLFMCYLMTGARLGELPALAWCDVDFEARTINICKKVIIVHDFYAEGKKTEQVVQNFTKTKSSMRVISITPFLVQLLREHMETQKVQLKSFGLPWDESKLVFPTMYGTIPYTRNIQEKFERITKSAKIEGATVHWTRHTYATRLYEAGVDIKVISEQLGHKSVKTTMDIYVTLFKAKKQLEVEKLDKLDLLFA